MPTRAEITEVAPRTWFVKPGFVNVAVFETDEGLVMVDAGFAADSAAIHEAVRTVTSAPLQTVVFTHGHIDHAFGLKAFLDAGDRPRIVAHEHVAERFRRYARTAGYNARINATQFQLDPEAVRWPKEDGHFFWPDLTYHDATVLTVGGEEFHLHHALGETDRQLLCTEQSPQPSQTSSLMNTRFCGSGNWPLRRRRRFSAAQVWS